MNSFVPTAVETIIGLELVEICQLNILSSLCLNYFPGRKG